MVNYACIGILWISLTACLGQSVEQILKHQFQDTSSECQEGLVTCALPLVLPYATASNPNEFLERARNIRLGEHCRKARKSLTCFQDLFGGNQCSDLDPIMLKIWKLAYEPILDDIWKYICLAEFKKFSIHYSCLLTEEVFSGMQQETCSSASNVSEAADCLGRVVKEECGSRASEIAKTLFESVNKRVEELKGQKFGPDEGGEDADHEQEQQSTLPENVYAGSLTALKKLLKRK